MREWRSGAQALMFGSALILSFPLMSSQAGAATNKASVKSAQPARSAASIKPSVTLANTANGSASRGTSHYASTWSASTKSSLKRRPVAVRSAGISCVPYARMVSGISVSGNAWQWWDNAAGTYARGKLPEAGSILAFRANARMRLGHVAVVRHVVNAREVMIDHSNWAAGGMRGAVAQNIAVVDVSEANDWSAVRVQLGRSDDFGAVYPTYGFIYDRPDNGVILTAVSRPAPHPDLNPAPRDLRPVAERSWRAYEEVAEAPVAYGADTRSAASSGWTTATRYTSGANRR